MDCGKVVVLMESTFNVFKIFDMAIVLPLIKMKKKKFNYIFILQRHQ